MTFEQWAWNVNQKLMEEGSTVLIDASPGDHWNGFYDQGWTSARMASAFLDWSNGAATEDGRVVKNAIRTATGTGNIGEV